MREFAVRKDKKVCVKNKKLYVFDVTALSEEIIQKNYSTSQLSIELELVDKNNVKGKSKERTAFRVMSYLRGNEEIIGINTIQLLGLACKGDEMAFLQEIDVDVLKAS